MMRNSLVVSGLIVLSLVLGMACGSSSTKKRGTACGDTDNSYHHHDHDAGGYSVSSARRHRRRLTGSEQHRSRCAQPSELEFRADAPRHG